MGAAGEHFDDDQAGIIEKLNEVTDRCHCDVVVEAVGKQRPLDLVGELTKERGRLTVAGYLCTRFPLELLFRGLEMRLERPQRFMKALAMVKESR